MRSTSTSSTRTFITPTPIVDTPEAPQKQRPKLHLKRHYQAILIGILIAVIVFLFLQYRSAQHQLKFSSSAAGNQQVTDLVAKVGKLIIVPTNETPTVATVVNVEKLRNQTFFANAANGDKVLVYSKEKEAILYRPSSNQIVTVAPVNVSGNANASTLTGQ